MTANMWQQIPAGLGGRNSPKNKTSKRPPSRSDLGDTNTARVTQSRLNMKRCNKKDRREEIQVKVEAGRKEGGGGGGVGGAGSGGGEGSGERGDCVGTGNVGEVEEAVWPEEVAVGEAGGGGEGGGL